MPVKHALLALLAERDLTGYELKLRFERVLGEFWQLNSGQVYSTLERMRRAGMIARRSAAPLHGTPESPSAAPNGRDAARAVFSIQPRGRRALEEWLLAPIPRLRPVRDPLFVKLAFCGAERLPSILRTFVQEARRYAEATETLQALVAREPMSHGSRVRWLVAEAARRSYEAQLGWIGCVQRTLARANDAPPRRRADPLPMRPTKSVSDAGPEVAGRLGAS